MAPTAVRCAERGLISLAGDAARAPAVPHPQIPGFVFPKDPLCPQVRIMKGAQAGGGNGRCCWAGRVTFE
jgi:hypothetical protein